MKNIITLLILALSLNSISGQEMGLQKLDKILNVVSDSIVSSKSQWRFKIKEVPFICIADSTHNRMRIMSPIADSNKLTEDLKTASLMANFHTALDVKYAISENVLWSVFIHPLKELTQQQVLDALTQVYYANINFGTSFTSTSLVFPGRKPGKEQPKKLEEKKIIKM